MRKTARILIAITILGAVFAIGPNLSPATETTEITNTPVAHAKADDRWMCRYCRKHVTCDREDLNKPPIVNDECKDPNNKMKIHDWIPAY